MKLYCMCNESTTIRIGLNPETDKTKIVLGTPMEVTEMGTEQYIRIDDEFIKHYPNLDILKCRICGKEAILEG